MTSGENDISDFTRNDMVCRLHEAGDGYFIGCIRFGS